MAREKKSFFGKLMGGDEQMTDEQVMPQQMDQYQNQPQVMEEVQVEEVQEVPMKGESEEWLSEYEGELNIDMYQTKDNVIIKSTIAGVKPEDLDITIANDMLTIRGERKREEKIEQDDYFYQECYWGGFSRSVILPVDVDTEHIEADLKDGILTVILPKAAKAKTKKIKVRA
jgi:HSP20 family protein